MLDKELIIDYRDTPMGKVPVVHRRLNFKDFLGTLKARLNIGRMKYAIKPGLYAVGNPDENAPVVVSANYKMSFDYLRQALQNKDAWILVLNTRGINVWCAAGKGTFGTKELVNQIKKVCLDKIVTHRKLIVPQLGAVGVSAHQVKEASGFSVIFGPIRAKDLPDFIQAGYKATDEMRRIRFNTLDRFILTPMEFIQGFKYILVLAIVFFVLSGLNPSGFSTQLMAEKGTLSVILLLIAYVTGTIVTPLFLPLLPQRAFSLKGLHANIVVFILLLILFPVFRELTVREKISWLFISSAIASFFAMNFTGSSTYTSLSGVKKEMKIAVPMQIIAFIIGFILWCVNRFV